MVKIGFMVSAPYKYPSWEAFETEDIAVLAKLGFDGIEIGVGDPADVNADRLKKSLDSYGLELSSWTTGTSYFEYGLCLTSRDDSIRGRAVERLKAHADLSAIFESVVVVGQMQGFKSDEPDRNEANARTVECMRQVADYAEAKGARFVLEPVNHMEVGHNHTAAEMLEVVDAIASPAVNIMLDTFHINIEEASLIDPIWLTTGRLGHVHVFENNRRRFGTGHQDLPLMLRTILETGYQGWWVLGDIGSGSLSERASAAMDYLRRAGLVD